MIKEMIVKSQNLKNIKKTTAFLEQYLRQKKTFNKQKAKARLVEEMTHKAKIKHLTN